MEKHQYWIITQKSVKFLKEATSKALMKEAITKILDNSYSINRSLAGLAPRIEEAAQAIIKTYQKEGKILLFGNGGSAADAQHLAAELVSRFYKERAALPAIALTTNSSIITAISNDYSYEQIFARQIQALAKPGDCVIAITTSGKSPNVIEGVKEAKKGGCSCIGLIGGEPSELSSFSDIIIAVPSKDTPRIQEAHILIGHIICQLIEEKLFNE
jgi:D-sedoheptulose 7-phosphate isomerase